MKFSVGQKLYWYKMRGTGEWIEVSVISCDDKTVCFTYLDDHDIPVIMFEPVDISYLRTEEEWKIKPLYW